MTTARFTTTGGRITAVEVSGHAGYADAGEDIVCAAISSTLDLTSCLLEDILGLKLQAEVDETGRILLALPDISDEQDAAQAQNAMSALMVYYSNLGVRYPDFIEVMEV